MQSFNTLSKIVPWDGAGKGQLSNPGGALFLWEHLLKEADGETFVLERGRAKKMLFKPHHRPSGDTRLVKGCRIANESQMM